MLAALVSPGHVMMPDNDVPITITDRLLLMDGVVERGECVLRAANECDGGPISIAFLTRDPLPRNVYACRTHRVLLEQAIDIGLTITIGKGES